MKKISFRSTKIHYKIALLIAAVFFSLFLCDWILLLLNFPAEVPRRISNPVNIEQDRRNIEYNYLFKTNNHGLRYRDISDEMDSMSHKIFVSGDSFTEGEGVDVSYRFTNLLENHFKYHPSVLFINGGLRGTGPLEYGMLFLKVGLKYDPDALLICLYVNDVANTPEQLIQDPFDQLSLRKKAIYFWPHVYTLLKSILLQREYNRKTETSDFISLITQRANAQQIPQNKIIAWKESVPRELEEAVNNGLFNGHILSYGLLRPRYWSDSIDIDSEIANKKWQNMTLLLSKILAKAKDKEIETGIVLIPSPFMYDPETHSTMNPWVITGTKLNESWLSEDTEIQKRLRLWAKDIEVPFLDLTPEFRMAIKTDKNLNWELDGHWNNNGHQVAAKAIESWLSNTQVYSFINNENLTHQ